MSTAPHIETTRPFGAHVRTRWWAPPVIIVILAFSMIATQLVLVLGAAMLESALSGRDLSQPGLTPLMMLGVNISLIVLAPIALLAMRWIAGVPWRAVLTAGRRFSWRRLVRTVGVMVPIILVFFAASTAFTGIPPLRLGATALALILVTALTTPLQAAAEEIVFRGAVSELVGSWFRRPGLAVGVGITVSTLLFGISHGSTDPWLAAYYTLFGLAGALMALITRGLEASIAFHAANNTLLFVASALMTGEQGVEIDRSAGAGGPFMLVFIGMDALLVLAVVLMERGRRRRAGERANGAPAARAAT